MAKYLSINWKNGMKLNETHFIGQERAMREELFRHFSAHITPHNYGILPDEDGAQSLDWFLKNDQTGQTVITLVKCKAISPSGTYIETMHEHQNLTTKRVPLADIVASFGQSNEYVYLYLNHNLFERVAVNEPNLKSNSGKQPFTVAASQLTYGSASERVRSFQTGSSQVTLGRIKLVDGRPEKDLTYIPPSTGIASSEKLKMYFDGWNDSINDLFHNFQATVEQVAKVELDLAQRIEFGSGEKISSGAAIKHFTQTLFFGLADLLPIFDEGYRKKETYPAEPLIRYLTALKQFAHKAKISFNSMSRGMQGIWHNYMSEMLHEKRGIVNMCNDLIALKYDHEEMKAMAEAIDNFLNYFNNLYNGLPKRDYTWRKAEEQKDDDIIINDSGKKDNHNTLS